MKKGIIVGLAIIVGWLCGSSALAAERTVSQVQAIAAKQSRVLKLTPSKERAAERIVDVQIRGQRLYAVNFENNEGFVIVSGDDRLVPVLGYSDQGHFDFETLPDNARIWLEGLMAEAATYAAKGENLTSVANVAKDVQRDNVQSTKEAIAPLVSTLWGQGEPFNNACPLYNSTRTKVGCVATAMAQVINYHMQHYNQPTLTAAEMPSYTTASLKIAVSGIPAQSALPDKNLLLDTYTSKATDAQKNAVAQLMLYCGTAVKMDYGTGSSSAHTQNVAPVCLTYFGCDDSVHVASRYDYTYSDWINLLYNELAAARPIVHGGHSTGGGHAFVVDGYDGKGLFHINWGWSGSSNGYFALSALNPDDAGQIGASSSGDGYNSDQLAIIGLGFTGSSGHAKPISLTMRLKAVNEQEVVYSLYNHTGAVRNFEHGLGVVEENGSITLIGTATTVNSLKETYGWANWERTVAKNTAYANMSKKIIPISREKGASTWVAGVNYDWNYVLAEYDENGNPTLTLFPNADLKGGEITTKSSRYIPEKQIINMPLTNSGEEFYGTLYLFASTTSTKDKPVSKLGVTALAGSQQRLDFEWEPTTAGTYNLWITSDDKGTKVLSTGTIVIREDPFLADKKVVVTGVTFKGLDKESFTLDETTGKRTWDVYHADSLKGTISIQSLSNTDIANFSLKVQYEYYDEQTGQASVQSTSTYNLGTLYAGKVRNLTVTKKMPTNKTYRIHLIQSKPTPTEDLDARYVIHLRSPKKSLEDPSVTLSAITDQPYQGAPIQPTIVVKDGETVITDECDISYASNTNVGEALVTITAKETGSYSGTILTTFKITAVPLTIAAQDATVTFGLPAPAFTVSYTGWKGSDDASVLNGEIRYDCAYQAGSDAGNYTITPSGVTAQNYTITFVSGELMVTKANALVITPPHAKQGLVENDEPQELVTPGLAEGGTMMYSLDNNHWSAELPTAVESGEYLVYYFVNPDKNHNRNDGGTVAVTIAPNPGTEIQTLDATALPDAKLIRNGQLIIRRGGVEYSILGIRH